MLDYYDVAYDTCGIGGDLEKSLGYRKILIAGKDLNVVDGSSYRNKDVEGSIFMDAGRSNLFGILSMSPAAVAFSDFRINKKAIEQMRDKGIALCIPASIITSSYGLQRSRNMYMARKLLEYARKAGLDVSIVTLARSAAHLCSYMQLVEIAKLIGSGEKDARDSIGRVNGSLVVK
ncbi:MAG: hypothetical protein KGI06_05020 [Candidatus Micrarchaeota archaeon]|nr:hypothetical protein [Candidatus Micrarchaeota archaeon]